MITKSQSQDRPRKQTERKFQDGIPYRWVKINANQRREIVSALGLLANACDYTGNEDKCAEIRRLARLFAEEHWIFNESTNPFVRTPKENQ